YMVNGGTLDPRQGGVPTAALFRNNGDRTFHDVTSAAGVGNERWGQGVCVGDVDNNGAPDLYVTNFGPHRLYRNLGQGRFADVAAKAGVAVDSWSTGCAFGDYDGEVGVPLALSLAVPWAGGQSGFAGETPVIQGHPNSVLIQGHPGHGATP